jgi:hypothetical protein
MCSERSRDLFEIISTTSPETTPCRPRRRGCPQPPTIRKQPGAVRDEPERLGGATRA